MIHRALHLPRGYTIGLVAPCVQRFARGRVRLGTLSKPRVLIRYVIVFGVLLSFERHYRQA